VTGYAGLPVIVGGGIQRPEEASSRVRAGASFIVVGTRLEHETNLGYMAEMAEAVHSTVKATI